MRKVVFFFILLISTYSFSKDRSFYFGVTLLNGINFPVGNNSKSSAYAPSLEFLFEKKISKKIGLQTGLLFTDRASNYDYVIECPCKDAPPGHFKGNRNTIYSGFPFYIKINWKKIYFTSGTNLNFPIYYYHIEKSPTREVYKGGIEDQNWIVSLNVKVGYDFQVNKNTLTINAGFKYDLFERFNTVMFSNSLLNIGLGIGYKFKFSKTN